MKSKLIGILIMSMILISCKNSDSIHDNLPSWNDSPTKTILLDFIKNSTDVNNPNFIPVNDRIVVFDNDGTLWAEQPVPFQLFFAADRIRELVKENPEWKEKQPFKAIVENDLEVISKFHVEDILQLVLHAHAINNVEDFDSIVNTWLAEAKHPRFDTHYTDLVYQPMLEVIEYLKTNEFKPYIVSGGSVEFMRAWAPKVYGIPKEQIIGTKLKTEVKEVGGNFIIERLPELEFNDDHQGKIISINQIIGKKPVIVFGNSDGDLEMMKYTDDGSRERLLVYINHTDEIREYKYDDNTSAGRLEKGLIYGKENDWQFVDMKKDWNTIFPN